MSYLSSFQSVLNEAEHMHGGGGGVCEQNSSRLKMMHFKEETLNPKKLHGTQR